MLVNLKKPRSTQNSKLSDFLHNASSSDKKRVYNRVIHRSIASQVQQLNKHLMLNK